MSVSLPSSPTPSSSSTFSPPLSPVDSRPSSIMSDSSRPASIRSSSSRSSRFPSIDSLTVEVHRPRKLIGPRRPRGGLWCDEDLHFVEFTCEELQVLESSSRGRRKVRSGSSSSGDSTSTSTSTSVPLLCVSPPPVMPPPPAQTATIRERIKCDGVPLGALAPLPRARPKTRRPHDIYFARCEMPQDISLLAGSGLYTPAETRRSPFAT